MPLGAASRPRARLASCEGQPGATNAVTSSAERTSAEAEGSGLLRRVITGGLLRSSLLSGDEATSQCLLRRVITAGLLRPSLLRGDEATSQCPRADSIGRGGVVRCDRVVTLASPTISTACLIVGRSAGSPAPPKLSAMFSAFACSDVINVGCTSA